MYKNILVVFYRQPWFSLKYEIFEIWRMLYLVTKRRISWVFFFCIKKMYFSMYALLQKQLHWYYCRLWKFHHNRRIYWNKVPIQMTSISSCCLGFETAVGPFWTSSSCNLRDGRVGASKLDNYLVLNLVSFQNARIMAFYASDISLNLAIYDIQWQYS